mmetsp:Transcript_77323/g.113248  ORF Transcript_77323/g.113248 Transcript_77323/m.113248 type:complete len:200 (+) Transcript_77323:862-1461(+)
MLSSAISSVHTPCCRAASSISEARTPASLASSGLRPADAFDLPAATLPFACASTSVQNPHTACHIAAACIFLPPASSCGWASTLEDVATFPPRTPLALLRGESWVPAARYGSRYLLSTSCAASHATASSPPSAADWAMARAARRVALPVKAAAVASAAAATAASEEATEEAGGAGDVAISSITAKISSSSALRAASPAR